MKDLKFLENVRFFCQTALFCIKRLYQQIIELLSCIRSFVANNKFTVHLGRGELGKKLILS